MFQYQAKTLYCENKPLADIAQSVGTPLYVYSKSELLRRARAYRAYPGALVCYAVKANGNPILLRLLGEEGLGADVTSGGELFLALQAAIPAERIIYSGVGKRRDEIEMALDASIRALHVESMMELEVIAAAAQDMGRAAHVGVRVNPDIPAQTHPYDSTGRLDHKFGVPRESAVTLLHRAAEHPFLNPVGLAAHIGSQITSLAPYRRLVTFLVELANEMAAAGINLEYVDVGGGLGIDYGQNGTPPIEEWIETVSQPVENAGYELVVEPGRSIVGPAGVLLTEVLYNKEQGAKSFLIVDAGMNDLIRPAMYDANHPLWPVRQRFNTDAPIAPFNVVGPVCETGDFLARERLLPQPQVGDLLALMQAGAYGFAMSSNYNGRLRLPEVLVDGDQFEQIRHRQNLEHLLDGVPIFGE
ncbi:MAG: diaminopimelate decarboxylase [Anaerolineaceae bacterium]|nr:MAG: diaminopimelate decarboxylase [Anaerolineaceae bacterium]